MTRIDVYPVGVLADLRRAWRYLTIPTANFPNGLPPVTPCWRVDRARRCLRNSRRAITRHIRRRQWHELRQTFNGYLAEPRDWPTGLTRCGRGWTQRRALRSLERHARRPGVDWGRIQPALDRALGR